MKKRGMTRCIKRTEGGREGSRPTKTPDDGNFNPKETISLLVEARERKTNSPRVNYSKRNRLGKIVEDTLDRKWRRAPPTK